MISQFMRMGIFAISLSLLFSCKDTPSKNHGAIVLGDSSTIVTEKDPQKLQDLVSDLQPDIPTHKDNKDTVAAQQPKTADTTSKDKIANTQPAANGNGLSADFTGVSVFIPNVNAKLAGRANLLRSNDAVYTLVSGNINGNIIKVSGNVTKVSQRYRTVVVLKNNLGTMPIDALSETTNWVPLNGGNSLYRITGLDPQSLEYSDASGNAIRNAVSKAAQRHRMSRRKVQEWVSSVHNVRAANQKPLYVTLRSVMWKIDGKDANGRSYSKQVRIDIPM